ncbi:TlpA family protein disulfide reductase [Niabella drilacis]|uniref:Thiol-disulfide isomerase or thioredoxin n=1 Tax=Niabella drilacis (strain DSM 25811 / CCM 8410 / CCUG 62505 / LMG 26954 / E90) TaxID=1285928 RepID=A0A1G6SZZ9_NIADE|nr:TlpA disulfide reductase family protein [Niabella drilacis]SDD22452.1 Thiol-disulfide isomerase or thioredoxin [Niabella drilacis]
MNKRYYRLAVILVPLFWLVSSGASAQEYKRVHLTGSFPDLPGARMFIMPLKIDTPLNKGKLDIWLENIEAGEYPIGIGYPLEKGSAPIYFRSKDGGIKLLKNDHPAATLFTYIYLDPGQSDSYVLTPVKGLTVQKILNYKQYDNFRSDLFGLNISSNARDAELYEKIVKLNEQYNKRSVYKIMDSLYQRSTLPDKIYSEFEREAKRQNHQNNYAALLKAKRAFAMKHPGSPIAALAILDIDSANLAEHLGSYQQIMGKMTGRAIKSSYYENMKLKIAALNGVNLKEGDPFALPSGKTPGSKILNYNPVDYKYTLVEFWASWCVPCRAQNPRWNAMLRQYKNKGFAILGVSLDQYAVEWNAAIQKDRLENWLHVSDLESSFSSANALRYGIQFIPFNLLIDSKGRILRKNIDPSGVAIFLQKNIP